MGSESDYQSTLQLLQAIEIISTNFFKYDLDEEETDDLKIILNTIDLNQKMLFESNKRKPVMEAA